MYGLPFCNQGSPGGEEMVHWLKSASVKNSLHTYQAGVVIQGNLGCLTASYFSQNKEFLIEMMSQGGKVESYR